ncbi:phosphatidylserine decarboxylase [Rickettsiales endosymbiont of Stachyamoeba lipophora]|uniref:phosphatidylserine decarboxylase n=1 Tax=Rickettsiales endosymbiont of Stachyamoeba lipophora TaxID=2486578 RepID=UPI000F6545F0|nr:phosphatidylserine decarboxylase [Rickettsiales endosymbiont of Stachyamoeba lipophora]AZL15372.1 phosphatidylserine decarboxylase [Rickettsiales endosymbiont of Stachyamoeba lipophora]
MLDTIKKFIPPIHPEGYQFIIIFALVTVVLALFSNTLGLVGLVLTIWCVFFFRDPVRVITNGDSILVSPADGLVQKVSNVIPPEESGLPQVEMQRISIFLNVFNVHVNCIPCKGVVEMLHYRPGKFLNAALDKASVDNERQVIRMKTEYGQKDILVVQIAGLIARRIVCNLENKQEVNKGEKFGIIRFGSRTDVYLPMDIQVKIQEGQTVIGGETVIADILPTAKA